MRNPLPLLAAMVACSSAPQTPPQPQPVATTQPAPAATPAPQPAAAPDPKPEAKPVSGSAEVVKRYLTEKYPNLMAGNAHVGPIESPALAELFPGTEAYGFGVGSLYPIATVGEHARRVLLVKGDKVVVDFDSTTKDADAPAALAHVLPAATPANAEKVAQAVATLLPLDPFYKSPELAFKISKGKPITALLQGPNYKYEIVFGRDGKVQSVVRVDHRPKPICYQHRAQAQALLDREHPGWKAGDVIWDDLSAERIPDHYVYEVRAPDGSRVGLVAVRKGPAGAWFIAPAQVGQLVREVVRGSDRTATLVGLQLQFHAGAIARAPLGIDYLP